ncbi:MAG: hypothetical protein HON04_16165 [Planctomicrobium sp.]|jgi:hypothetical protein|nr:hypothetical protein [Planctomicrobium sp.]
MDTLQPTDQELLAFLDEMLPTERSAQVEKELRQSRELQHRAALLLRRRDGGGHTLGEIWRRRQLSCLSRETLGTYVLGVADSDEEDYILFHTQVIGCRICQANLRDLQAEQASSEEKTSRQKRYFESSAGLLRSQRDE